MQVFKLARGGCDNHECHNRNPRWEIRLGGWMTSCLEAMGWEFWWFLRKAVSWDLNLGEASPVEGYGWAARLLGQWVEIGLWAGQFSWGLTEERCRNSQHSKKCISLSLSSCRKTKSQKVNKRFVPELKKVDSVSGFLCIWTFYVSVYFTHSYMYMLHFDHTTKWDIHNPESVLKIETHKLLWDF